MTQMLKLGYLEILKSICIWATYPFYLELF